ncbi:MAG: hypothetical protein AB7K52_11125 [Phycisphaerales bacterium]
MLFVLGLTAALVTIFVIALLAHEWWVKGEPLMSWRNFFLVGYLQFYCFSIVHWSLTQYPSPVYNPRGEMFGTLAATLVVFLGLWLLCYRWGFRWTWPARIMPQVRLPLTTSAFLICTVMLAALSLLFTGIIRGGVGDSILAQMRVPLMSAAGGCATVLVVSNPKNFLWWGLLISVMVLGLIVATIGTIDRRNFLSVLFVVAWVWYYISLRDQPKLRLAVKLGAVLVVFFLALATYNAGRQYKHFNAGFEDRAAQFQRLAAEGPNLSSRNVIDGMFLQDTHICTQAIMENYPSIFPYQPLHGILYYFGNPIPRVIWPSKPEAMGIILQRQLRVPANLGIGCIGHGWAEAAWIGVVYYAIGLGLICGIADRLARMRADNPFFLISIGCSLGNVLGLARGETSLFMVLITVGFVVSTVVFWVVKSTFWAYMLVGKPVLIRGQPLDRPVDSWTGLPLEGESFDDASEHEYPDYPDQSRYWPAPSA